MVTKFLLFFIKLKLPELLLLQRFQPFMYMHCLAFFSSISPLGWVRWECWCPRPTAPAPDRLWTRPEPRPSSLCTASLEPDNTINTDKLQTTISSLIWKCLPMAMVAHLVKVVIASHVGDWVRPPVTTYPKRC